MACSPATRRRSTRVLIAAMVFAESYLAVKSDIVICVVNLDPFHKHWSLLHIPLDTFGIGHDEQYQAHDLLSDERYRWSGHSVYVELAPPNKIAHIIKVRRW